MSEESSTDTSLNQKVSDKRNIDTLHVALKKSNVAAPWELTALALNETGTEIAVH